MRFLLILHKHVVEDEYTNRLYKPFHFLIVVFGSVSTQGPNPHVILTTGCNHWEEGLDVVVEGDAVRITNQDMLERLASVWATKWDGRWQYLVRDGYFYHHDEHEVLPDAILVFSVTPTKVFAFAKGHFSHTRHQF